MKVKFYTLGCKVNQYESQAMSESLAERGYMITSDNKADILIVNSCTVTATADQKTRQTVRRFKRNNPDSVVVLTGCMPQAYPEKAKELIEADIVIGNKNNSDLPDELERFYKYGTRVFDVKEHKKGDNFTVSPITRFEERTRAYVKIQDGCNRFCSYCIIPTSRGRVRSKPLKDLESELKTLADNGYSEVVLVGINLSSYGQDINVSFPDAVKIANDTPGILRVRLGSLEPDHLTDEVIEQLSECEKLCPQFHISLQSGCDKTLKSMNRHYTADEYRNICRKLREKFKDCTITTDVMVGFAGETEEDFKESLNFVKDIAFEKVHVFPYSIRKGTKAEKMGGHIEKSEKEKRAKLIAEEAEKIRLNFFRNQINKIYPVLFESETKDGFICGYTPNYIPVKAKFSGEISGKIYTVRITDVSADDYCLCEII